MKKQSSSSCELGWLLTFLQGTFDPQKMDKFELLRTGPTFRFSQGCWGSQELTFSNFFDLTKFPSFLGSRRGLRKTKVFLFRFWRNCPTRVPSGLAWETGKFRQIRSGKTSRFAQAMYTPQKTESWTRVEVPCPSSFLGLPQGLTRSSSLSF